jgi:glycosyltransferase involved in cell wall biosynthesis
MKIAFITRSTLYDVPGGDTIQVGQIVKHLKKTGAEATIFLTNEKIDYSQWDLFHFFNITRPADILFHLGKTKKPFILSPILVDYTEYDSYYREGFSGFILKRFPAGCQEYIKTLARWLAGKDALQSKSYIWTGQNKSIRAILKNVAWILPNSEKEYQRLKELYAIEKAYAVVPNGIDPLLFHPDEKMKKNNKLVVCAARIEGLKNQLNLIRALNDTDYTLLLIGSPAPNQRKYYEQCRKTAAKNILFHEQVSQTVLVEYYKAAKVHALPSWFETCGLSSLEAAAMG